MAKPVRTSDDEPERCEFFFDRLPPTEMCAADDVFHHGKLLPSHPPPPRTNQTRFPKPRTGSPDRSGRSGRFTTDYRRLRSSESPPPQRQRPRWSLLPFGLMRAPAASTGMRELRSRQRRRCQAPEAAEEAAGWKVLRSLSCRAVESAAVAAAPLGLVSHMRGA